MAEEQSMKVEMASPAKRPIQDDTLEDSFPAKKPKNEPGKYDDLTREELLEKLENIEHRKSCLESDIAEKNAKLAAVITAAEFSEEKLKEIFAEADIEKKQNGRGRKANSNKKPTKPIEPWILEMEVEYTISGQRLKIFTQCSDSPTCMMECMVCQPIKKITITAEQMNRHLYGKLHVGQMKRFKYIPNEDENITKLISEMESQVKNGQKTTPNPATEQPPPQEVGPWILAQEVKNIQTGEHCKAFVQPSPLSPVLQCMICKPVRKVEIRTNQFERHVNGKPHMEQMKKFSIVESI